MIRFEPRDRAGAMAAARRRSAPLLAALALAAIPLAAAGAPLGGPSR